MVILVNKTISQFHTERGDVLEMFCEERKGLDLRRGIAIFLLLAMGLSGFWPLAADRAFAADSVKVNFTYTKKIEYGNVYTYDFKAVYGGENKIAYCVRPRVLRLDKGSYTATACDSLTRKLVYYSYGYPGYNGKTKAYLADVNSGNLFAGTNGQMILFHRILSYPYDKTSDKSLALYKLTAAEASLVVKMYNAMKSWPDPPAGGQLAFDKSSVKASVNSETGLKETEMIKLNADAKNDITVQIPEGTSMVKQCADGTTETFSAKTVKAANISGGDSFRFTAPVEKTGTYKSPAMSESQSVFNAFIIKNTNKQDTVFGLQQKRTVAFEINWNAPSVKTSAADKESGAQEVASGGMMTIVDKVSYTGLTPGEKYKVTGKLMDKETEEPIDSPEVSVEFTPEKADGTVEVSFEIDSKKYAGKSLVVFEKIYQGETVVAAHEDIHDAAQTITVKEEEKPTESETEKMEAQAAPTEPTTQPPAETTPETEAPAEITPKAEVSTKAPEQAETTATAENLPQTSVNGSIDTPATGDETGVAIAFMIMAASLLGIGCSIVFRKPLL